MNHGDLGFASAGFALAGFAGADCSGALAGLAGAIGLIGAEAAGFGVDALTAFGLSSGFGFSSAAPFAASRACRQRTANSSLAGRLGSLSGNARSNWLID